MNEPRTAAGRALLAQIDVGRDGIYRADLHEKFAPLILAIEAEAATDTRTAVNEVDAVPQRSTLPPTGSDPA